MKVDLSTLVSGVILGASILIYAPAQAQGPVAHAASADSYDYALHKTGFSTYTDGANGIKRPDPYTDGANGIKRPDPYTDGAHGIKAADPYSDGANVLDKRSPFTDGAHGSAGLEVAGMDHTGVSAPPARSILDGEGSAA